MARTKSIFTALATALLAASCVTGTAAEIDTSVLNLRVVNALPNVKWTGWTSARTAA